MIIVPTISTIIIVSICAVQSCDWVGCIGVGDGGVGGGVEKIISNDLLISLSFLVFEALVYSIDVQIVLCLSDEIEKCVPCKLGIFIGGTNIFF